jgi:hypothetical protein
MEFSFMVGTPDRLHPITGFDGPVVAVIAKNNINALN